MAWQLEILLVWVCGWLATLAFGVWLEVQGARIEQREGFLRSFLYPRTVTAFLFWPLYRVPYLLGLRLLFYCSVAVRKGGLASTWADQRYPADELKKTWTGKPCP